MRKLRIFEHISLDGVIQNTPDENSFPYTDWTAPYRSPEGLQEVLAAQGSSFDLLLGRRTYDMWSGYWPKAPAGPMSDILNAAKKYVVTHQPQTLEWGPFEGLDNIVEGVRGIKAQSGPDLLLWGSSTLTSTLIASGLVDEIVLLAYPVLIGTGKRLLAEGAAGRTFELLSSKVMASGIIVNRYKISEPLKMA